MISVITPTTIGGFSHLAKLMPGLSQEKDLELIIIDNASKDGTCNYLSQYDCLVKINKIPMTFSQSNNIGATFAKSDYLLFLNNDTQVTSGFAQEMLKTFEQDPKIGVVGCLIYKMDLPHKVQHAGVVFTPDYIPYELGLEIPSIAPAIPKNDPRVTSVREVPSVTAACMMVKRSVFEAVGGFDERYKSGWEDTDLCLRIREAGYKIWYTGKTYITHKHFGSPGRFKHEVENRALYDSIWVHTGRAKQLLGDRIH